MSGLNDEEAVRLAKKNLDKFKSFAKIYYDAEDESLVNNFLAPSFVAISKLIPYSKDNNVSFWELVSNRALYAYNDKLSDFSYNFQALIYDLSGSLVGEDDD